jgi:hypothetical protein
LLIRRWLLWTGAFLCPFFIAAVALLFPATQRVCANYLLGQFLPGASLAAIHVGLQGADAAGLRLPVSGGWLEVQHLQIDCQWWPLLWKRQLGRQNLHFSQMQFYLTSFAPGSQPGRRFDLVVSGGVQEQPGAPRPYVGSWKIQAAPQWPLPDPSVSAPLAGDFLLQMRDPALLGPPPFAEMNFTGGLDAGFFWSVAPNLADTHDGLAQFFSHLPSAARQAAGLRLLDAPGQYWKIRATFSALPAGGYTWEIQATLWGADTVAADLATLNLLSLQPNGAPVVDADNLAEGPTFIVSGIGNQVTSVNFAALVARLLQ